MVRKKIRSLIERLMAQERSPHKLALTCALGTFIAISPLIGAHTIMTFLLSWMLRLSIPAVFMVSLFINNPWTMVPIYSFDHFFGKWLFTVLDIDHMSWDPAWLVPFNAFLERHTGIGGLSLSAFLIGGNLLAVAISVMLYMPMKRVFRRMCIKKNVDDKIDI
jgi:uncharacterized protein (DUF2062 family)